MSNLEDHARRELELLGEEPDVIEWFLSVIRAFEVMGHSGGSASFAIPILTDLLQFKNLRPLTDNPDEWEHIAEDIAGEPNLWQNKRNSAAFSHDGGKTYYIVSDSRGQGFRHMSTLAKLVYGE